MEKLSPIEKSTGQPSEKKSKAWIFATLGIIVIVAAVVFFALKLKGLSGNAVAENVVTYLNAQAPSEVTLQSVKTVSGVYEITVLFQGQEVQLYATKDGKYFGSLQPLGDVVGGGDLGTNEPVDVSVDDDAMEGRKDAPVTIVEFSDYQCPFCRKFWTDTYSQLKKNYIDTGKVQLVFRDFPLSFHPMAEPSARAAECVREKGGDAAYFRFHDKIFSEQNKLDGGTVQSTVTYTENDLKKWAKAVGYDISSCLDSGKYADEVAQDQTDGQSYGVQGTPAFFVNGKLISGAVPYAQFQAAIEEALVESA